MAEDRMLSDEILLGLIKKNGGGGTNNYNDLKNLPQINGETLSGNKSASDLGLATETALADKADKSAVKNEFLGTLDEWNALTTEQKKAYDTYQIKGDYTDGSGGLPDYSTTEQKTGQKWIDGKDRYFKTIACGALPNADVKTVDSGLTNVKVYKMEGVAIRESDNAVFPIPYAVTDNVQYQVSASFNNATGIITLSTGSDRSAFTETYITLYYTKAT